MKGGRKKECLGHRNSEAIEKENGGSMSQGRKQKILCTHLVKD